MVKLCSLRSQHSTGLYASTTAPLQSAPSQHYCDWRTGRPLHGCLEHPPKGSTSRPLVPHSVVFAAFDSGARQLQHRMLLLTEQAGHPNYATVSQGEEQRVPRTDEETSKLPQDAGFVDPADEQPSPIMHQQLIASSAQVESIANTTFSTNSRNTGIFATKFCIDTEPTPRARMRNEAEDQVQSKLQSDSSRAVHRDTSFHLPDFRSTEFGMSPKSHFTPDTAQRQRCDSVLEETAPAPQPKPDTAHDGHDADEVEAAARFDADWAAAFRK